MAVEPVPITVDDAGATVNPEDAAAFFAFFGTAAADSPTEPNVPKTIAVESDVENFFLGGPLCELARASIGYSRQGGVCVRLEEDSPGAYGNLDLTDWTGTVVPEADATAIPINDHEVVVEFVDGGTLGVAGMSYRVALDGRDANGTVRTYIGRKRLLGTATSITVREQGSDAIAARFNLLPPAAQVTALIALVTELLTDRSLHYNLGATTHNSADTTSDDGFGAAPTTLAEAITRVNQVRTGDLLHAANVVAHNSADTTSYASMPAAANDGPTAIALAIYLKTGGNTHNANATVHDAADVANDITATNPTPGTIAAGDVFTCPTTAPTFDAAAIDAAFAALAAYSDNVYTVVAIKGAINPDIHWDSLVSGRALLANAMHDRPTVLLVETRLPTDGESDADYRNSLDAAFADSEHADIYRCADYGRYDATGITQLRGQYRRSELVPLCARAQAVDYGTSVGLVESLARSAGARPSVFGGPLAGYRVTENGILTGHDERFQPGLHDAGFGVVTSYALKAPRDVYVHNPKTAAPSGNRAPDLRQRRVLTIVQLQIKLIGLDLIQTVPAHEPGRTTLRNDIADFIDGRMNDGVRSLLGNRIDSFRFEVDRSATIALEDTQIPWTAHVKIAGAIVSLPGILTVNKV